MSCIQPQVKKHGRTKSLMELLTVNFELNFPKIWQIE